MSAYLVSSGMYVSIVSILLDVLALSWLVSVKLKPGGVKEHCI
jgi:hypothetical protein